MNLLKECTFFDRDRNALIELDDLVEEACARTTSIKLLPTSPSLVSETTTTTTTSVFLILYFTADWLPEVSNNLLNEKLKTFVQASKCQQQQQQQKFELVFVSSDKTSDSYWEYLNKFKFIRYSLAFHEKDLKASHY